MNTPVPPAAGDNAKSVDELRLNVYLAEYERIGNELLSRFESQRQAFAFTIGIFGTLVTVITAMENPWPVSDASGLATALSSLNPLLLFWVPLVVVPFGFIWFDNELMIWGIIAYTRVNLHTRIADLVGDDHVLLMEQNCFAHPETRSVHHVMSLGRWTLFLLPIVVSLGYAVAKRPHFWSTTSYAAIFALDLIGSALLVWAMVRAAAEQEIWKRIGGANPTPSTPATPMTKATL